MGKRYINEFLAEEACDPSRLTSDWYYAFKFFLSKLYMQGRNDSLSDRYLKNMTSCLDQYFQIDPTSTLEALWQNQHIPHDAQWDNFEIEQSDLWQHFDNQMGKRRDREMVIDVLRYLHSIPLYNIVNLSLNEIGAGRIQDHRNKLMQIWGAGPKTSAFYLRDVIFLFNCELTPEDSIELQPIDTWVKQVVNSLRNDQKNDMEISIEDLIVRYGGTARNSALLNAGMWYLGKHSFKLVLKLLTLGTISPQMLQKMDLRLLDGVTDERI